MKIKPTCSLALLAVMGSLLVAKADYLPNNFWPNPGFENGVNLSQTNGVPTGWTASGGDPTMCQVTTDNSISPTHSLCVIDGTLDYCAWDSDLLPLAGHASPGDTIIAQWYQLYSISSGEMRLTITFSDINSNAFNDVHSVVSGDSPGWGGTIGSSTFTKVSKTIIVPVGAAFMTAHLVSGGSGATVGSMVIDDLSVALQPTSNLLAGNFWPNPSFELGSNLDNPTNGLPAGWNAYNGSTNFICQVTTNNYVSTSHALAQIDNDPSGYGSWYSNHQPLTNTAIAGSTLNIQWFELYSIANGEMRMVFTFFNAGGGSVGAGDINYTVNGNSAGWQGAVAGSGFTRRNIALIVPPGAVSIGVQLVSGGPGATTGIYMIDDLSMATPPTPPILAGNFWPNSGFESGSNLNQTNGVPTGWVATGNDSAICQVTTNAYFSATHALALVDADASGYGEWDADLHLGANASPGDTITVQWSELYSITNGPMRVTVLFLDVNTNVLTATDNNSSGNSSGWAGQLTGSTFTLRNLQMMIPHNAVFLRVALVSGGPQSATGVYLIDDLSVAKAAYPATVQSYNFFPNPTFESGVALGNPTVGLPAGGWQRGGSSAAIDQVLTNNSISPSHALALVDNDVGNYGEWYMFLPTTGFIGDNDAVDVQWYQLYNVTNGNMRLSFAFLDSGNNTLWGQDFNTGTSTNSPGWNGNVATSTFQKMNQRFVVPVGTTQLRVNFASGGASTVTGVMLIDDLSMRLSLPVITGITSKGGTNDVAWNSMSSKLYSVFYTAALAPSPAWSMIATNVPGTGLSTVNSDTAAHPGSKGFYRVLQQ